MTFYREILVSKVNSGHQRTKQVSALSSLKLHFGRELWALTVVLAGHRDQGRKDEGLSRRKAAEWKKSA